MGSHRQQSRFLSRVRVPADFLTGLSDCCASGAALDGSPKESSFCGVPLPVEGARATGDKRVSKTRAWATSRAAPVSLPGELPPRPSLLGLVLLNEPRGEPPMLDMLAVAIERGGGCKRRDIERSECSK